MTNDRAKRWGIILIFAGFAIGIPGFWLLIGHAKYEAGAKIKVTRNGPIDNRATTYVSTAAWVDDPDFIQAQFKLIKSEDVLGETVETLHLDSEWGNRYANGLKLEKAEAIELLKQCLRLKQVSNTLLIEICAISEDPAEAPKLANATAEVYCNYQKPNLVSVIIDRAQTPTAPIGPNRTLGKILLWAGVLLILAGARLLLRVFLAAKTEFFVRRN